ncbi:MAG: hypothetical protein AB9869_33220 [Verrucomicrobiia bacterium]
MFKTLNSILYFNQRDQERRGGKSEISWKFFYNRFGVDYPRIIDALERLGLLQVLRVGRGLKGLPCYAYVLTEKCHDLLSDSNREYLHKLLTDKPTKRRLQKRISKRGYWKKDYGDVRDEIKTTIDGITVQQPELDALCDCYPSERAAFTYSVLIQIVERKYDELSFNQADGRVPNPYTELPARVKRLIQIDGLPYITTADIRSAYPSMWAHYLWSTHPAIPGLLGEKAAWEEIFLHPSLKPKEHLAKLLGIRESEMKEVMITYFNGRGFRKNTFARKRPSDPYVKFDSWVRSIFPNLYALWTKTDIRQTGNQIGRNFETKLMLDSSIFKKARSLGLRIGYENDGFSIFGTVPKDHPSITALLDFVTERSVRLLGMRLVFAHKQTPEFNRPEVIKESYEEKADNAWENWEAYRKRFHSLPAENQDWSEYEARKAEVINRLERCVEVLEGIQPKPIPPVVPA